MGLAGVAFIAYLSSLTTQAYTATQYALFSSLMSIVGKALSGWSGVIVDAWGYPLFFAYAAATGLPAIALVLYIMRRQPVPGGTVAVAADGR
jgi:PAT family beta-lactamase induction signal transducer AmpG